MIRVGFIPTTLVDYPGEVASTIFLTGCNFKCPYCHNPGLVRGEEGDLYPLDDIVEILKERKGKITGVVITGGEPTIYKNLPKIISKLKETGLKVKLDTNGSNPNLLKSLDVDYIALDIKTYGNKYRVLGNDSSFNSVLESLEFLKSGKIDYEIRSVAAPLIFTKDDLIKLLPLLKGAKKYYITGYKQGDLLNMDYNNNTPYSNEELREFRDLCLNCGIDCTIR